MPWACKEESWTCVILQTLRGPSGWLQDRRRCVGWSAGIQMTRGKFWEASWSGHCPSDAMVYTLGRKGFWTSPQKHPSENHQLDHPKPFPNGSVIKTARTAEDLASFSLILPSLSPARTRGETKRKEMTRNPLFTMFASLVVAHTGGRENLDKKLKFS